MLQKSTRKPNISSTHPLFLSDSFKEVVPTPPHCPNSSSFSPSLLFHIAAREHLTQKNKKRKEEEGNFLR